MKRGEKQNLVIFTQDHIYFYAATGYMNGSIKKVCDCDVKCGEEIEAWRDLNGSFNAGATTSDSMAEGYERERGRDGWDYVVDGYAQKARRFNDVDEQTYEGDSVGDSWESDGDFSVEELLPGTVSFGNECAD